MFDTFTQKCPRDYTEAYTSTLASSLQTSSWNAHVDQASKKASNSLAFLRRNLYNYPSHTKAQSYQTLVRPILDYASSTWDPYTQSSINKLEGVQYRAARFVTGDYGTTSSVSEMVSNLGWETLQDRRTKAKMVMMYRITYGLIDIFFITILHPANFSTRVKSVRCLQPYCRTDAYRCSFFPLGIRLWNQLPNCAVTAPTLETFNGGLPGHYFWYIAPRMKHSFSFLKFYMKVSSP